jgi:hypothetical protein
MAAPPSFPVFLLALPRAERPGSEESPAGFKPTMDLPEQHGVLGTGHVDDGVEGDHGVEAPRRKVQVRHIGFNEVSGRYEPSGQLQLACREVYSGNREAMVYEPAGHGDARAAAKIEDRRAGRETADQLFQHAERRGIFRVLGHQVALGHAVVAFFDDPFVRLAQRAVTPPSTIMHAPMQEADSSEAR